MITLLLIRKIIQLLFIVAIGFIVVKSGVLKSKDSSVLSLFSLYIVQPFMIFYSFQKEYSPETAKGLFYAFLISLSINIFLIVLVIALRDKLKLNAVQQGAIMFPNAGNLIVPIIYAVLGSEWVIYTSPFMAVQIFCVWTVGIRLFRPEEKLNFKKIFLNPNVIAITLGLLTFFLHITLPDLVAEVVSDIGSMLGPISMFITGMLFAEIVFKDMIGDLKLYVTAAFRLLITPAIILAVIYLLYVLGLLSGAGREVILVAFLPACSPMASTICQFAALYTEDGKLAGGLSVFTTLLSAITMPAFVFLFEHLI